MKRKTRHQRARRNRRRLYAEALEPRRLLAAETSVLNFDEVGDVDLFGPNAAGDLENGFKQNSLGNGNLISTSNVLGNNNQTPEITGTEVSGALTETDTTLTSTGQLNIVDINLSDTVTVTVDSVSASGTFAGTNPLSNAALTTMMAVAPATALEADPTAGTNVDWTFTSGASGDEAFDFLAAGETLVLDYVLKATDDSDPTAGEPTTATETVTVTITGSNDSPDITGTATSAALTETDTTLTDTGQLTVVDIDLADKVTITVDSVSASGTFAGTNPLTSAAMKAMMAVAPATALDADPTAGTNFNWTFTSGSSGDAAFDFLAEGETFVLSYALKATDSSGATAGESTTDTQTVTVTITGSNDSPDITGTNTSGAVTETDTTLTSTGQLNVVDIDLTDKVTITVGSVSVGGTFAGSNPLSNTALKAMMAPSTALDADPTAGTNFDWKFTSGSSGDEAFDFLAEGETMVLSYVLVATDDSDATTGESTTDTQTVTVTITGSNDSPSITGSATSAAFTETDTTLTNAVIAAPVRDAEIETLLGTVDDTPFPPLPPFPLPGTTLTSTGQLNVVDIDLTDKVTVTVDSVSASGTFAGSNPLTNAALKAMMAVSPTTALDADPTAGTNFNWTFTSGASGDEAFDFLAAGETLVLDYVLKATDDSDPTAGEPTTATETVTVTITGSNDSPDITGTATSGAVTETDTTLTTTGQLNVVDIDLTDKVTITVDSVSASGTFAGTNPLTSAAMKAMMAVAPATALDADPTAGTNFNWTFTSGSSGDAAFDFLAEGETFVLSYALKATDSSGATAGESTTDTQTVTVTITGSNDSPDITGTNTSGAVTETDTTLTSTGQLNVVDIDLTDKVTITVGSVSVGGTFAGSNPLSNTALKAMMAPSTALDADPTAGTNFDWKFTSGSSGDEAFDFLAEGETMVLSYVLVATDDSGATTGESTTDTQTVTVTITGSNDSPSITGSATSAALTETDTTLTGTSQLTVVDIDLNDKVTITVDSVSATGTFAGTNPLSSAAMKAMMAVAPATALDADPTAGTNFNWTFTSGASGDSAFDFLAEGETLVLDYVLKATDDSGATAGEPATTTQTVTVTITGSNDSPDITGTATSGAVTETDTTLTTTGQLNVVDIDLADKVTITVDSISASGTFQGVNPLTGAAMKAMMSVAPTTALDADPTAGTNFDWKFTSGSSGDEAFDFLAEGETLVLSYVLVATDDSDATTGESTTDTQTVTVTITGSNDSPSITGSATSAAFTETDTTLTNAVIAAPVRDAEIETLLGTVDDTPFPPFPLPGTTLTSTGQLNVVDIDLTDKVTVTVDSVSASGTFAGSNPLTNAALKAMMAVSPTTALDADPTAGTNFNWTFTSGSSGDAAFDFLAEGETLVLSYVLKATDSSGATTGEPATTTQTVTVTITGSNDSPELTGTATSGAVTETDTTLTTTGQLNVVDIDLTDKVTITVGSVSVGGTFAGSNPLSNTALKAMMAPSTALDADPTAGTNFDWKFTSGSSGDEAFDFLAEGETMVLSYVLVATDDSGATTGESTTDTQTVTVTITGSNDSPSITGSATSAAFTETDTTLTNAVIAAPVRDAEIETLLGTVDDTPFPPFPLPGTTLTSTGQLNVVDIDLTDKVTVTVDSVSASGTFAGSNPLTNAALKAMMAVSPTTALDADPTAGTNFNWTFTSGSSGDAAFDFLAEGETLVLDYVLKATDDSGATAGEPATTTQTVTVTITGSNDSPELTGTATSGAVTETDTTLTTTGHLNVVDVDLADKVTITVHSVSASGTFQGVNPLIDAALKAMIAPSTDLDADPTAGSNFNWKFTSGASGDGAFDFLAEGETMVLSYVLKATDDSGATTGESTTDAQTVTITITGSNDSPDITGRATSAALTETDTTLTSTGQLNAVELDLTDTVTITVDSLTVNSTSTFQETIPLTNAALKAMMAVAPITALDADPTTGTNFDWTFTSGSSGDGAFDFLAEGETLVLDYVLKATDSSSLAITGESTTDTQTVTVTITGSNDSPDITGRATSAALTETDTTLKSTGQLHVVDIDLSDSVTITVDSVSASGTFSASNPLTNAAMKAMMIPVTALDSDPIEGVNFSWMFNSGAAGDHAFDFLAEGETMVLSYVLKATDDSGATTGESASDTQTVTITITGSNDSPDITGTETSAALTETDTTLTDSGTLNVVDIDLTDQLTITVDSLTVNPLSTFEGTIPLTGAAMQAMMAVTSADTPAVVPAGLVAYYPLNDGEGLVATDAVGRNPGALSGNFTGSEWTTDGKLGSGLQFTRSSSEGSLVDATHAGWISVDSLLSGGVLRDSGSYTFSSWVKWAAPADGDVNYGHTIWGANTSAGDAGNVLRVGLDNDGDGIMSRGVDGVAGNTADFSDGQWHFLTMTMGPDGNADIYVDGSLALSKAEDAGLEREQPWSAATLFQFGMEMDANQATDSFSGTLDELAIWNRELSASEIADLYKHGEGIVPISGKNFDWTFTSNAVGDGAFDFLAEGETLVLDYVLKATDSSEAITGATRDVIRDVIRGESTTDTQTVTVTIIGSNDSPDITGRETRSAVTETDTTLTTTGQLHVVDIDLSDNVTITVDSVSVSGRFAGMNPLTNAAIKAMMAPITALDSDPIAGMNFSWMFNSGAGGDDAFDFLAEGETMVLSYVLKATDDSGVNRGEPATDTQTVSITVFGSNDSPEITGTATNGVSTETDTTLTNHGTLNVADIDSSDTVEITVDSVAVNRSSTFAGINPLTGSEMQAMMEVTQPIRPLGVPAGLVAYYPLNDGHGLVATDVVGRNPGELSGNFTGAEWTDGKLGGGLQFTRSSSEGSLVDATHAGWISVDSLLSGGVLRDSGSYTFSSWVKWAAPVDGDVNFGHTIWGANTSAGDAGNVLRVGLDNDGDGIMSRGIDGVAGITTDFSDGQWHLLAMTMGPDGNANIYVDGSLAINKRVDPGLERVMPWSTATSFQFGMEMEANQATDSFSGILDELGIWNRELSGAAIAQLYNRGEGIVPISGKNFDWTFTSDAAGDGAFDFLADGETLVLDYVLKATDDSGATTGESTSDTKTVTVTIIGRNDSPDITGTATSVTLTETDTTLTSAIIHAPPLPQAINIPPNTDTPPLPPITPLPRSGQLQVVDVDLTDKVTVTVESVSESGSFAGTNPLSNAQFKAMMAVDPITAIDADPSTGHTFHWTFTSGAAGDHAFDFLAEGETLVLSYVLKATDDSGVIFGERTTDTQTITVTITGSNDSPEITGAATSAALTETDTTLTSSGRLNVVDVDLTDKVTVTVDSVSAGGTFAGTNPLTGDAMKAMMAVAPTTALGADPTAGSNFDWTFTSGSRGDHAFDFLAKGETLVLSYTLKATDDSGATTGESIGDTQTVAITITGRNDSPDITLGTGDSAAASLTETNAGLTSSGTVSVQDVDLTDTVKAAVNGVTVTGTGSGSVPDSLTDTILKGYLSVDSGNVISNTSTTGTITWAFDSDSEAFNFLATSETLILTYTISATDDDAPTGASDTQTVTITITGSNDAPVITVGNGDSAAENLTETNAGLTSSGTLSLPQGGTDGGPDNVTQINVGGDTLSVQDLDVTDTVTTAVDSVAVTGTGASSVPASLTNTILKNFLSVDSGNVIGNTTTTGTIIWSFDSGNEAFNFLAAGETLILTYTVSATDDDTPAGGSDTQEVTITITGSNDAPDITVEGSVGVAQFLAAGTDGGVDITPVRNDSAAESLTETNAGLTSSGTLSVEDVDLTDTVSAAVDKVVVSGTGSDSVPASLTDTILKDFLSVDSGNVIDNASTTGTINWSFDSGNEAFNFLATGETLILTYKVSATDDDAPTGASDAQTVVVTITGTNDNPVPVASGSNLTTNEDTAKTFAVTDFHFADDENDSLASITISSLNLSQGDTLKVTQSGSTLDVTNDMTITAAEISTLAYTPAENANGSARSTFAFAVNDADSGTATATMSINVTAVNDVPAASASSLTTSEDTAKTFAVTDFHFADVETDSLASITVSSLNLSQGDTLKVTQSGSTLDVTNDMTITAAEISTLAYTPAENANGSARSTFAFAVNDADSGTATATMSINVTAVNDVPAASASSLTTSEDTAKTFAVTDFHFADVETDSLASITISSLNLSQGDTLKVTQSGSTLDVTNDMTITAAEISTLAYTPAENANGSARSTFAFAVNDADSGTATATMSINVTAVNDVPAAAASSLTTSEDTAKTFAVTDFHFADVETDSLASITISSLNLSQGDTLKVTQSGSTLDVTNDMTITAAEISTLAYTPAENANGSARSTFAFAVNDVDSGTATATMSINVTAVNDPPVASGSNVTTNEDTAKTFAVGDFQFTDQENDTLVSITVGSLNLAAGDTLTVDQGQGATTVTDGMTITAAQIASLAYTSAENANGEARSTFVFAVNDADSGTETTTMTINVTSINDAPAGTDKTIAIVEDGSHTFAASDFGFSDASDTPPNALAAVTISNLSLGGGTLKLGGTDVTNGQTISVATIGTLVYAPAANHNDTELPSFDFVVTDDGGTTGTGAENTDQSANTIDFNVDLITNGSFETPDVADRTGGEFGNVPGWVHGPGSTSPAGPDRNSVYQNNSLISNRHGDQVVALQGHNAGWSLGQTVSTHPDVQHTLSFLYGMGGQTSLSTSISAAVYLASNLNTPIAQTSVLAPSQHNVMSPASLTFTPTEGDIVIRFTETAAFGTFSWLDHVVLVVNSQASTSLLAAGGAQSQDSSVVSQQGEHELTQVELQPIVDAAIARWNAVLDSETSSTLLESVRFEINDLPNDLLGSTFSTLVSLDTDAAGYGWFVDETPNDNIEFDTLVADTEYAASQGSEAFGSIDLLTVVMHELGHVLGQAHSDGHTLMAEELATSTRRLPAVSNPPLSIPLSALKHDITGPLTDDLLDLLATDLARLLPLNNKAA